MNRRGFIKQSCIACITGIALMEVLPGCAGVKHTMGALEGDYLVAPLADFLADKNKPGIYRKCIVIENDTLKFPICVYRFSDTEYEALWLQCTHQGNELRVFDDRLQCPAHGSEFTNRGLVQHGPAAKPLKKFPVTMEGDQLKISLK